jgi:hypothetical protein
MPTSRFTSHTPFSEAHPNALAVYCSDGRFTEAVEELLQELGDRRIDTLTIPGGAALLHLWSATQSEADTVRQAASFLIEAHHIVRVVLVAHGGCGYYRRRYATSTAAQIEERQVLDLGRAAEWLAGRHRGLEVATNFARAEDGRTVFDRVPRGP